LQGDFRLDLSQPRSSFLERTRHRFGCLCGRCSVTGSRPPIGPHIALVTDRTLRWHRSAYKNTRTTMPARDRANSQQLFISC
jgi:hypothetical protein